MDFPKKIYVQMNEDGSLLTWPEDHVSEMNVEYYHVSEIERLEDTLNTENRDRQKWMDEKVMLERRTSRFENVLNVIAEESESPVIQALVEQTLRKT